MSEHERNLRAAFAPDAIDEQTANINAAVEKALASSPPIHTLDPALIRAQREAGKGPWGKLVLVDEAEDRVIPGPEGDIRIRVFVPDEVRGVYLHFHGGGWVLGANHHRDVANWNLAQRCKLAVVSAGYRLAPENPYPAGHEDCERAAAWLVENAMAEFGSDRIWIGGESAGAYYATTTLIRMRDRHDFTGFAGANLVYGVFDVGMTPSAASWGSRNLILSTPIIEWFADHFVPAARRGEPDVSPIRAKLHDLPPAQFTVGTLDPLLDDSLFMHARWLAAGNEAGLAVYPGGIHGFTSFPSKLASEACERMHSFLGADA
jgi:acetyl esterase